MICSVLGCQQLVLGKGEENKDHKMCYFHAKCRDGLFGDPHEYPMMSPNNAWYAGAPPIQYVNGMRWKWDLTIG